MTRPPHTSGDGPTQLIGAAFWLFLAGCLFVALALLLHTVIPGGIRP